MYWNSVKSISQPVIQIRIRFNSGAVMLDDLFQSSEAAIVHVGGGHFHVAQGRRGELALVTSLARDPGTAEVAEG